MAGIREKKKQKTRREITRCAEKLFSEKGFNAVTMEEIAAAAFVGVGTLYNYYGSKGELLVATMTRLTEEILADAAPMVVSAPAEAKLAIADLLQTYMDGFVSVDMALLREVISLAIARPEEIGRHMFSLDERLISQLADVLTTLQARGLLAADLDPGSAAFLLYSQSMTFLLLWTQLAEAPPPDERGRQIKAMVNLIFRSWDPETDPRKPR